MDSAFPMSANPPSDTLPFGDAHEALVHARRSVRAYRPDPVPDALLHQLLQSARRAPSGGNLQPGQFTQRSEEHTSELQSPCNLVCRLLLEKKKKKNRYLQQVFVDYELNQPSALPHNIL